MQLKRVVIAGLAAGTMGATSLAAVRHAAARRALAQVPAEFRSPFLSFLTRDMAAGLLRTARWVFRVPLRSGPGVRVRKTYVPGEPAVRVLVTIPAKAGPNGRPAVLYIHGGGMVVGSPQAEAPYQGKLARELDAVVVAPDYRLAPENPFPAALDDCMSALRWTRSNAGELGIDPDRVAVTGSSAGGGLSAAVAQRAHDEGIALRAQVLVYPMLDDRSALRVDHGDRGRFLWTPRSNVFGWTAYLGRPPRMSDAPEYAAPARRTDLAGLAPAWIGVGDLDLFHEESIAYAEALRVAAVPCELVTVPGMYHGADALAAKAPAMQSFRRSSLEYLRKHL
jgi:acetyl esterase/lipase